MKISNNALNFLLAQYRAIFKRAYVKGIASAVLLTAGLAAGQAQAADNDQWYYFDNSSSTWKQHEYNVGAGQVNQAAGAVEDSRYTVESGGQADGSITSGSLTIGAHDPAGTGNNDVQTVTTNAAGGYIYSSGNASISNFNITDSHVTLLSGGSIGQDAHGAYIEIDNGNANATDNYVTVNAGTINNSTYGAQIKTSGGTATATGNGVSIDVTGTNTLKVSAANTDTDGIFGARIKTADGIANASGNYVEIKAAKTVTSLSLGNGGNGIVGALAEGTETVSVTGNRVEITLEGDTPKSLGSVYSIQGGFALNQTENKEASTLTADSNSVTATGLSLTSTSGAFIFGGRAMQDSKASGSASELVARNNTVSLTSTDVNTSAKELQVVGNMAFANPGTNPPNSSQNSVSAIGDGTADNVYVDGGTFSNTSTSLASGFLNLNPDSMIAGGYAETVSGGGNAVANLNKATIKNITGTNINLYGGVAYSNKSATDDQVTASQNTLTVDAITLNVDSGAASGYTQNNIVGGFAALGGTDVSKAVSTASNNTVTVTNSTYSKANSEKQINANIAGAIVTTNTSGATIAANQNSVAVDQGTNLKGSVYGAYSHYNGTFTGNTVSFDATLRAANDSAESITGVHIATGDSGSNTDKAQLAINNNTVTIGANAKLTNTSIQAADLATNNADNTNLIHSGNNVIFNGTQIIDDDDGTADEYALAGDDVQITSTALIHVKHGTLNISGIANGATTAEYYNGTGTVATGARIANADTINVYNSLDVQGDDSLFAVSTGAELKIDAGSAADEDDEDAVTTEKATLKITQTGLTNYLTATKDLAYDLDGDASQVKEANDAAGAVTVTSGGTIDFKDTVLLSAFDFTSGGAAAGKINVDTGAISETNGSIFKADTVTVAHKLATNTTTAQGKYENLDALDNTSGVAIVANTLNLGATDLSSDRSAAITFGQATVKEEINFIAKTSGANLSDDPAGTPSHEFNDGYHLTSKVIGSNFMLTNDQYSNEEYYTSLAGNINGVVTVEGDNGLIHIKDGDWTANDLVTVTSGGNITVGLCCFRSHSRRRDEGRC